MEKLTTGKWKVEIGLESLKFTKLNKTEDIEALLLLKHITWSLRSGYPLTGKGQEAYAAMENEDAKDYEKVKQAIPQRYNMNEETHGQSLCSEKLKEEEIPVELLMQIRRLAKK